MPRRKNNIVAMELSGKFQFLIPILCRKEGGISKGGRNIIICKGLDGVLYRLVQTFDTKL
ncbi:MAG: hypothetical protein WCF23_18285 [Candidatus Nitrosopolaris sp.]